jgi:serine protease Do
MQRMTADGWQMTKLGAVTGYSSHAARFSMRSLKWLALALTGIGLLLSREPLTADTGNPNLELARQLNSAFVEVAEKISPTVVVINVVQLVSSSDDEEDDSHFDSMPPGFWRDFHKHFNRSEQTLGQGSGVIIRSNGYILTNRHVIENAESIEVRLQDGRSFKGVIRGVDPQSDVAVIKIDAEGLPSAALADSAKTRVGEFAIAIGAPFSLDYSVTFGHVSAKSRSNVIDGYEGAAMDQDFIQTDALINPGNSGGPLVNIDGEVIGINTLIRGLHTGIGFAIPSNLAREVADQLITEGKFTRPWLGIAIQALKDDPDLRELIKGIQDGVVVSKVMPNSPASKSELKPSDVILSIDGTLVSTPQQLRTTIRGKKIGQPITLDVFRNEKNLEIKVVPSAWVEPSTTIAKISNKTEPEPKSVGLGVTVQALTADLAKQFGVEASDGILVASVEKDSPAANKGLRQGDVITSIDHQSVTTPKQFREALKRIDLKKGVLINLISNGTAHFEILKAKP